MKIPTNTCLMPWVHLYIDTRGNVKACCSANITFGNVNEQSLIEIWQGESINKFRAATLANKQDKRCGACWKREQAGKNSMRTETIEKFGDDDAITEQLRPTYLDIRFSNLCNLTCVTCWHGASSSWFEEAKQLGTNWGDKAIITATPDNLKLLDEVFEFTSYIEEIYFAGGEPLMMEEHYVFLEKLIEHGLTNTFLRYNTNLTRLQLKHWDVIGLWKHFNRIEIAASIDALEEEGAVIRRGLKWDSFLQNCKVVAELSNVHFKIAPTVSALNVHQLPALHRFFVEHGIIEISDIYLNVLDRPAEYNISKMSQEKKQQAEVLLQEHLQWLTNNTVSQLLIQEFQSLNQYMYVSSPK